MASVLIIQLVTLGLVIGANNLAAAMALGSLGVRGRRWRIVLTFGAVEFLVPLVGIWLGQQTAAQLEDTARGIGPFLLAALGLWTIGNGLRAKSEREKFARRLSQPWGLLLIALGLSTDNLIVGFSLGLHGLEPLLVAVVIASFSMLFTWIGIAAGEATHRNWERRAEVLAGLLLLGMAGATWADWFAA